MVAFSITDLINWCFHRGQEAREQWHELRRTREKLDETQQRLAAAERANDEQGERIRIGTAENERLVAVIAKLQKGAI